MCMRTSCIADDVNIALNYQNSKREKVVFWPQEDCRVGNFSIRSTNNSGERSKYFYS